MTAPVVSVVLPCFNQGHFLGSALESVLAQTIAPSQIVVVDDGSTDRTAAVAASYPGVTYLHQAYGGLARARNRGLQATVGEYVVFLDADDRLLPTALAIGVEELETHPDCAFVFGRCERIDERGARLTTAAPSAGTVAYEAFLRNNPIWTPAVVMFSRSRSGRLIHFDPRVGPSADYDVYLGIVRQLPVHDHGRLVAQYRLHDGSMSSNAALMLRSTVLVLRRQRQHLGRSPERIAAYEHGLRSFRHHYGDRLVAQMRSDLGTPRRWGALLRGAAALLCYHPTGVLRYGRRRVQHALSASATARAAVVSTESREGRNR